MGKINFRRVPKPIAVTAIFLAFAFVGTYLLAASHASGTATLTLSPGTSNISLGSTFTVSIVENSGTTAVNAVEADLTYDQTKLQFVSIDSSTSPFTLSARATGGSGTVMIANAALTPVTGSQTVAKVTFTAIGTGSTAVDFASTSGIAESTNNTDVLGTTTGGTYTVSDTTAPSVPSGLTVSSRTATSIGITWTAATDNVGVTGYKIYRGGTQVGTSVTPAFSNTGLTPSNNYSYTVVAVDAAGNASAQSSALATSTTADTTAPSVPAGLSANSRALKSLTVAWTASTDNVAVTGYRIYRGGAQVGTSTTTSFTNTGLTPSTSYSFTVAAYDAVGNVSAQTSAKGATTISVSGDANNDGHVDYLDLSILSATWQSTTDLRADFNHDGSVTYLDLSALASNWGK
jgi:chitodextrinase